MRLPKVPDEHHELRLRRQAELGLTPEPQAHLDDIARSVGTHFNTGLAMVNFPRDVQYFPGMYAREQVSAAFTEQSDPGRTMPLHYGGCPEVLRRRAALPLGDVMHYARFVGNPVLNEYGVRSYLGAPIIDAQSRLALGTVCVVDDRTREWTMDDVVFMKSVAATIIRPRHDTPPPSFPIVSGSGEPL